MAILRISDSGIEPLAETTFSAEGLLERGDLQRLLKKSIHVLGVDVMVVAEEFGEWEDSRRRIDLLAIDREANLVIIELKRDDSAHMELQAVRYASMVSAMTLDHLVRVHERYLEGEGIEDDARDGILAFLQADDGEGDPVLGDARIILASSDFSRELTTTVLWLNEKGVDIRCVRLKPYREGDVLLVDAQQIIPLAEAQDYTVRLREKRREERARSRASTLEEFWRELAAEHRETARTLLDWVEPRVTRLLPGRGSCIPIWENNGVKHHLFRMKTNGNVVLYFDWMSRKPPFSDRELRVGFMNKLNEIEGVDLPAEKLERRPRIGLKLLEKPESMAKFQAAIDWWLEQVVSHHGADH